MRRPALAALACMAFLSSGCLATKATVFVPTDVGAVDGTKAWQPTLLAALGDPASSGLKAWTPTFDAAPTAYDIDGDGVDELIAQANDTKVYVFSALTGEVLAALPTSYPPAWHIERVLNPVVASVLRPGEPPSLVVTDHAAYVAAWRFDPTASTATHFAFTREFDKRMDACHRSPGMDAKAAVGDLTGDGTNDIVVQTEEVGLYALRPDGSTLWSQCWGGGNSAPVIADLDGDGHPEVVIGSDGGFLSVLDGATGKPKWTFDAKSAGVQPASISVSPTVADLDGTPPLEVLFTARDAPPGQTFASDHLAIFAVHQDPATYQATLLWMRQPSWANPLSNTQLVVRDVDGDGKMDILGMDWNTIGHYPGNWERLGPAHLFRLTAQGEDVWVREMDTFWSNQDIALAGLGAEGPSVLANGPAGAFDGIWQVSARTGTAQAFLPLEGWDVARGPQLFDLRHDGRMQLVLPVRQGAHGALLVFELGAPFDAPWRGSA